MKKPLFALTFFLLLLALPQAATAQRVRMSDTWTEIARNSDTLRELQLYQAEGKTQYVLQKISFLLQTRPDINTVYALAVFITQHSFEQEDKSKLDINYMLLFSDVYFLLAQMTPAAKSVQRVYLQNALAGAMTYEALAMSDNARCTQQAGWPVYKTQILFPRLKKITPAYLAFTPDQYKKLMESALAFEDDSVVRPANVEICTGGAGTSDPDISKLFLNPYVWANGRKGVHDLLTSFWTKRYEEATQTNFK